MSNWGDEGRHDTVRPREEYGGFWRRVGAYIIDAIIMYLPVAYTTSALGLPVFVPPDTTPEQLRAMAPQLAQGAIVSLGINWMYYALLESSPWQATIGKIAFNMVVTDLDGNRISFARATGRYFGIILSSLILFIGLMMAGWTEKKQALHDMLAGCLVVLRKRLPDGPPPQE